mmetsp:Transcript_24033/g.35148  ORF Transcript_24033/g.35148 Transcript_24033/m.35148 type:complete len:558 (+) Transcript_24033:735-2408(+)
MSATEDKFDMASVSPLDLQLRDAADDRGSPGPRNTKQEFLNSSLDNLRLEGVVTMQEVTPESTPSHSRGSDSESMADLNDSGDEAEEDEDYMYQNDPQGHDNNGHPPSDGQQQNQQEQRRQKRRQQQLQQQKQQQQLGQQQHGTAPTATATASSNLAQSRSAADLLPRKTSSGLASLPQRPKSQLNLGLLHDSATSPPARPAALVTDLSEMPRAAGKITPLRRTPNSFRDLPDHALGGDSDGDSPIDGALLHSPTDSFGVGDGLVPANALNDSLSRATTRRSVTTQSLADFDAISRSTSNITARTTSTMSSTSSEDIANSPIRHVSSRPNGLAPVAAEAARSAKKEEKSMIKQRVKACMQDLREQLDSARGQHILRLENRVRQAIANADRGGFVSCKLKRPNVTDPLGITFTVPGALPNSSKHVERIGWDDIGRYVVVTNIDPRHTAVTHGLMKDDVVYSIDGVLVKSIDDVRNCMKDKRKVKLKVVRALEEESSTPKKTNVALGTDMMKLKVESEQLKSTRADIEHEIKAATKTHLKAAFKALRKRRKEAQSVPRP